MTTSPKDDLAYYRSLTANGGEDGPDVATGRFKAIFPFSPAGTEKEEKYVSRMVQRDRDANFG